MKKQLFSFALFFCSLGMNAQDCKTFLYMTTNAQVQLTLYDKKGKQSGIQTWKIGNVKKEGNSFFSTINTTMQDEKGKEIANSAGTYKCTNGVLQADMKMAMPQQQAETMNTAEAKMTDGYLEYPYSMSVGQSLKDAEMNMEVNLKNGMLSKVNFKETNRKVDAKEKLTTPAGTWDAYLITYNGFMRTQMAGIGIPFNFVVKEWFVPGIGVVKTESYAKGGKLMGSTMITSIKQ